MAQVSTQQTETHNVILYMYVCKYMHLLLQMLCVDLSHMTLLQGLLLFDPFARIILLQGLG